MRSIYSDDRRLELFWRLLESTDDRDRVYVYRIVNDKPARPAIYKGTPFSSLESFLRDEHGGGKFQVMIRRGETMLLTGGIAIASPSRRM
jgi:hypothetical protein